MYGALAMSAHGVLGKHFKLALLDMSIAGVNSGVIHGTTYGDLVRRMIIANARGNYVIGQAAERAFISSKSIYIHPTW